MVAYFRGALRGYRLCLDGPQPQWEAPFHDPYSSPALADGLVFSVGPEALGGPTVAACREAGTGQIRWLNRDGALKEAQYSSPVVAYGKLYALVEKSKRLVTLDAKTGALLGNESVNALLWASPSVADGMMYLRLSDGLAAYDLIGGRTRR